jgi:hypothetical protein
MDKDIAKRRIISIAGAFVIVFILASCTTTSINQNGAGNNACANNASCVQDTTSASQAANSSPSPSPPIPDSPTPRNSGNATPPPTQSSYLLQRQETLTIGLAGVNVDQTGIFTSDGEAYDLQYQPGSNGGWQVIISANIAFFYWLPHSTPSPESCAGMMNGSGTLPEANGEVAHTGDRYCFVDFNIDPAVIAYMQVTNVDANGVTVNVRLWDHT